MHVVIVESPAKSKTINKYLGNDYKVLASFGHIRDLPSKDGSVEPDNDFAMHYEVDADSKRHITEIANVAKTADSIILATDPDREGEAISWHVLEALRGKKAIKKDAVIQRVVFNEITKKAVLDGVANPRELDMDLVNAQQARRALDYLVGFTLSPVLWRKLPGSRSAGRVQSVALRLICERESEIEAFISQEYWTIAAEMEASNKAMFTAQLTHLEGQKLDKFAIPNEADATRIAARMEGQNYTVQSVEGKQVRRNPQPPFTTSTLQQEAARKLGFGAKRTMMIAQKLYEGFDIGGETVGLITYMRTDGVTVSQDAITQSRKAIARQFGDNYVPEKPRQYTTKAKNAQEAHEAIRPTDLYRTPEQMAKILNDEQLKLYTLVWKRMMASQMESAVLDQTSVNLLSDDKYAQLRATGSVIRFDGFLALYKEGKDDEKEDDDNSRLLPPIQENESLPARAIKPAQHFTEPLPRYSEASLVKKLEELGIGRPSTYASIISVLIDREYVRLDKKRFHPEERGRIVTAFLESFFKRYVEYDFTANLEEQLDEISAGKIEWKEVLRGFWNHFHPRTDEVLQLKNEEVLRAVDDILAPHLFPATEEGNDPRSCPKCDDGQLGLRLGKFGAFIGCSHYPECNFTRQIGTGEGGADAAAGGAVDGEEYPKMLGVDNESGHEILLKKGPYGLYVELSDGSKKPKRVSIPKDLPPENVDIARAQELISLPREIGKHPESGEPILAGIGRYGPYVQHGRTYASLANTEEVFSVGINHAVTLIADKESGAGKKAAAEPLRVVGTHPDGGEIALYEGRYGPYVKHGKINASLPKGADMEKLTVDEAVKLIADRKAKPAATKGRKKKAS